MKRAGLVIALAVIAACKEKSDKPATPPAMGSDRGSATVVTVDAGAGPAAAATPAVPLLTGAPKFGCLGWSALAKVAACVTGRTFSNEPSMFELSFVGSAEPAVKLAVRTEDTGDVLEDTAVAAANSALARLNIQPFPSPATEVTKAGTTELGKGVSLVWTSKQTQKGGDNMAPTHKHTAVVKCAGKSVELAASELEGVDPTFMIWSVGDHVVIETIMTTGREGEYGQERTATVLDLATCKSSKVPT